MILARLKELDHDVVYVDLADPPAWFRRISPLGKVPLLRVGDDVLFESCVINEYLDESCGDSLHPDDPLERARHRAWMAFSDQAMWHAFHLTAEKTESAFRAALENMWRDFDRLEKALSSSPCFSGASLCLVDISFAPLFQQLEHIARLDTRIVDASRHSRVHAWARALCDHAVVRDALGDDFTALYHDLIHRRGGYLSRFLDGARFPGSSAPGRY